MSLFSQSIQALLKLARMGHRKKLYFDRQFAQLSEEEKALMIEALYVSPRVLTMGVLACVFATLASFAQSMDMGFLGFAAAFVLSGVYRIKQMHEYITNLDSRPFSDWKSLAVISGVVQGLLLGTYCAYTIYTHDHFNELLAFSLVLGSLVTIPSRNFSSRRLVRYQLLTIGTPVISALLLQSDWRYWVLATLCLPMFLSIVQLADKSRDTLIQVIRRRVEIKTLLRQFDTATNFMQHGFVIIDKNKKILVINARAMLLLGIENSGNWVGGRYDELLERALKINQLTPTAKAQLSYNSLSSNLEIGTHKVTAELTSGDFIESTTSYRDGQLVVLLEDVSERIRSAERITFMATHDSLTGLCNREHFHDLFGQQLSNRKDVKCMLAVIDLDDFKNINDTYGHSVGDELLISVADAIKQTCDNYAISCRFGGDEFVILVPEVSNPEKIEDFPRRLHEALSEKVQLSSVSLQPQSSIGLVVESHSNATIDEMFARADLALYESKAKSRGGWTFYSKILEANHRERQILKDELALAIENDDIKVSYQPIINLASGRVSTFEALSRWKHPEHGEISPSIFIPLAEEMGIVGKITSIVLRDSIAECCKWPKEVGISVNLSATDFDNPELIREIDCLLWSAQLNPHRLEVEITEGTFIENKQLVATAVNRLQELGVRIALDDFGTGYSNFSYLQEVSLNKLKIDRCFVKDILENHRSALLLNGISDIAKRLEMSVTVEGIETEKQLNAVRKVTNIDNVQGWVFSKAVNPETALALATKIFSLPPIELEKNYTEGENVLKRSA